MFHVSCFMNIAGFQKLTLIDYPGKLATTVFTVGCSFRCPFCHNPELVLSKSLALGYPRAKLLGEEFFEFLKKRKGKLEGVCITGGEPTIQPDIIEFIKKLRKLGYAVKLDSNGTRPDVLKKVIDENLVDFIAMDIKNSRERYLETAGISIVETKHASSLLERVKLSVDLIMNSGVDYEFRTTVVPHIHREEDFLEIAEWISGARAYYLQEYRDMRILDESLRKKKKNKIDLEKIVLQIKDKFGKVGIRR